MFKVFFLLAGLSLGITPALADANEHEYHFTVKRGDSLSKYFSKLGLSDRLLANLLTADRQNKQLNQLSIGNKLSITLGRDKRFKSLTYHSNNKKPLTIELNGYRFSRKTNDKSHTKARHFPTTVVNISRSFGYDAQKAGISLKTINIVVEALSWQLDFGSDLHKGDQFIIVHGQKERPEAIVYKGSNKKIEVFSYTDKKGRTDYYNRYGHTLNIDFLKAPLKYKRISSKFQLKRYHPILKTWRPHRAVDYAADYNTPVYSTANGVVKLKGNKGALGKAVIIQHGSHYTTVYAHLSKYARNLRKGKKVSRGQVIGYVGSTGRSTGPHLHYEIRYKGKRKNPLTHKPPVKKTINRDELWEFRDKVTQILASI